jgi:hypothetical protein
MIRDFMKKNDMHYTLSVFEPECGSTQPFLSKDELVDMLSLQHDERIKMFGDTTPLLLDVVE